MAGEESLLPLPTREAALTILDQSWSSSSQHPLTSLLSSLLTPLTPRQALSAKEKAVTLTWAETTQPRIEVQDPCQASPEPAGPDTSSQQLEDLLA